MSELKIKVNKIITIKTTIVAAIIPYEIRAKDVDEFVNRDEIISYFRRLYAENNLFERLSMYKVKAIPIWFASDDLESDDLVEEGFRVQDENSKYYFGNIESKYLPNYIVAEWKQDEDTHLVIPVNIRQEHPNVDENVSAVLDATILPQQDMLHVEPDNIDSFERVFGEYK